VVIGAVLAVTLGGCSPADITGVTLSSGDVPVVTNCGSWIVGVEARDAATGRLVWSAAMTARARKQHNGAGHVELGRLPDGDWRETMALALDPRPTRWAFSVDTGDEHPTRLRLRDADLAKGAVVRPGHDAVSPRRFRDDVCGYAPTEWARYVLGGLGVLVLIAVIGTVRDRRVRQATQLGR